MTEKLEQALPPLICQNCRESQVHARLDLHQVAYHCPHYNGGTLAIRKPDESGWAVVTGVSLREYRAAIAWAEAGAAEIVAAYEAERAEGANHAPTA